MQPLLGPLQWQEGCQWPHLNYNNLSGRQLFMLGRLQWVLGQRCDICINRTHFWAAGVVGCWTLRVSGDVAAPGCHTSLPLAC